MRSGIGHGGIFLPRRGFIAGTTALAASSVLPAEAHAYWGKLVGKYIGGLVIEWAVMKALDYFWDTATKRAAILPYVREKPDNNATPYETKDAASLRFHNAMGEAKAVTDHSFRTLRLEFWQALKIHSITPGSVFGCWGPPTSASMERQITGADGAPSGAISGQWFDQNRVRYVVVRTWGSRVAMLPILSKKFGQLAEDIVHQRRPVQDASAIAPLEKLVLDPDKYRFSPKYKPCV